MRYEKYNLNIKHLAQSQRSAKYSISTSIYPFVAFFVLSLSLSANNLESSLSFSEANLLWAIVCLFFSRAYRFRSRKGLDTRESNNIFLGCKFDPKKQLLDADDVIGGKYVINAEY
jgi:hypothetical protein